MKYLILEPSPLPIIPWAQIFDSGFSLNVRGHVSQQYSTTVKLTDIISIKYISSSWHQLVECEGVNLLRQPTSTEDKKEMFDLHS